VRPIQTNSRAAALQKHLEVRRPDQRGQESRPKNATSLDCDVPERPHSVVQANRWWWLLERATLRLPVNCRWVENFRL